MAYTNPYELTGAGLYSGDSSRLAGQAGQLTGGQSVQAMGNKNIKPIANPSPYSSQSFDWGKAGNIGASTLGGLADTLSQKSTDPMDFSVDKWAGYSGSAKGFASGGPWGAIIGGSLAQLGTFNKVHSNLSALNTGVNATQYDANGRPLYSGQEVTAAQGNVNALRKGVKAINTSVDPATHLISFIRGTERQIQRKRRRLTQGIQAGQADYNRVANQANEADTAMSQYRSTMNKSNRLRSLYNIGNQLY